MLQIDRLKSVHVEAVFIFEKYSPNFPGVYVACDAELTLTYYLLTYYFIILTNYFITVLIRRRHIDGGLSWAELLRYGLIEYINVEEEDTVMIAMMVPEMVKIEQTCRDPPVSGPQPVAAQRVPV